MQHQKMKVQLMRDAQLSYLTQYYSVFSKMQIISRTDTNGIITSVNNNFCKISGYSAAELKGFSHNKIRHPDMTDKVFAGMWKTITAGKIWQGEVKNLTKKGDFYWTRSIVFPIFDDNKKIIEFVSFREDITKKKVLEQRQEKEDNLRREILHSQSNMVILVHKSKGVIFMNNQCFKELPFKSRVEFTKKHRGICELFLEREGFLQQTTKERHWLKDFEEYPSRNHKAIILNQENEEEIYSVFVNEFKDNKNLLVINLVNITELEECKFELNLDQEKLEDSDAKIKTAIRAIEQGMLIEGDRTTLLEEVKAILNN